jgi:type IV secretory pathway TrbD component
MNNFAVLQALVFEPRKAFAELDQRPRFWWPLLLVALSVAAINLWYTAVVDIEWLTDLQLRNSPLTRNMTSAEIERLVAAAADRRGVSMLSGTVGAVIVIGVLMWLSALYYLVAGKITGVDRSYRHWLAMATWTSTPTLIAMFASAVVLITASSNQISQSDLQPLSLNALLLHRGVDQPGHAFYTSLNLPQFLSLYLAASGIRVWSGRGWTFSIIFAALPFVLVYGIWAFFALR